MKSDAWSLNPEITFLNHGSFGATPRAVLAEQQLARDAFERDPVRFLAPERDLEPKLDRVRDVVAQFVNADPADLAFVRNATDGVNAVLRSLATHPDSSFALGENEEIVVTDHGYAACSNAARYVANARGARVVTARIPFPIESPDQAFEAIASACTDWTKLILVDAVTSPTGLVLPIERIVEFAHREGIRVLVDAAHGPGMLPMDLNALGADYVTANHHKWIAAPKVSGFLHVRREHQDEVRPTVISHAAETPRPGRSRFLAEFDWTGTFDPSPLLAVPAAFDFWETVDTGGLHGVRQSNRALALEARGVLCEALGIDPPAPDEMIGSLVTLLLPAAAPVAAGVVDPLQARLFDRHRIEVPIWNLEGQDRRLIRISAQAYNELADYERLASALREEL